MRIFVVYLELQGQQDKNDRSSMTHLFEAIKKIAEENPDGFTVKIPSLEFLISGYIAAYSETQNCFGDEGLLKVLEHATTHDNIVGGWRNKQNRQYYFDSSKVFETREEAIEFGRKHKQIAIFDLYAFREIRL
jgi:fructokinase